MRFACLNTVAPGADLAAQCAAIAAAGCAGVETLLFPGTPLESWQELLKTATADAGIRPAVVILGGLALYAPGQELWLGEALQAVAEVGAAVLMTPEYRPQDPLPLFPPYPLPDPAAAAQVERAIDLVDVLSRRLAVPVYFEPLTPFESRFWREVATVQAVCAQLDNPWIGLALDFHNLNITEASIVGTLVRAAKWVRHIHLADNNRRLPGRGHIDFRAGVAALQAMGYDGWYSFECAVEGDFVAELQRTVAWLRTM